ncbi:MAG: hypothetical protein Q4C41_09625 [Eggerthellaceae bacterium]|nr:hypothetical protein [Eggerthellaceae bacterium]
MTKALVQAKRVTALALALLLVCAGFGAFLPLAHADELDGAQAAADDAQAAVESAQDVLADAESSMAQITGEYDALAAEVERLQAEIDASATEVMAAQQAVIEGRTALGKALQQGYRTSAFSSFLTVLLDSADLSELLRNIEYLNQIMDYQAGEIAAQQERREAFQAVSDKLSAQKDEQERVLFELEEKRAQAQSVVDEASAKLAGAQDTAADRLAALQAQAQAFADQAAAGGPDIVENATTVGREEVIPDTTPVQPDPGSSGASSGSGDSSDSSGSGGADADASAGWLTGIASAYGGSSDPTTPNPGTTATGAVCDDWSMGVAVPMSMPNYRSYFGRTVEIRYGGMTVYAVVNDCGGMGGGSRVLDLQPGVWKAFGFSDCYDWGLRTVTYRFL